MWTYTVIPTADVLSSKILNNKFCSVTSSVEEVIQECSKEDMSSV